MHEATLQVQVPKCWAASLPGDGASVHILDRKVPRGGRMEALAEISQHGDAQPWDQVIDTIRAHPSVVAARAVAFDDGRLLGIVRCKACLPYRALLSSGCFITNTVCRRGSIEWTIRFDDRRQLRKLMQEFERAKVPAKLLRVSPTRNGSVLTHRQAQVLRLAMDLGYFDFPKAAGVAEVAKRLGVSKSTACETLKRAERNALRFFAKTRL